MADGWREQVAFLRSLNGTAAHILLALLVAGRALTVEDLAMATGYEKRTLSKALALLEALGMAGVEAPQGNGWALPAAVRGMLSGMAENEPDTLARAARVPSSSSSTLISFSLGNEGKKKKNGAHGAAEVEELLIRAGLGRNSRKMGALLALGLDPGYVRLHVERREALLARGKAYPVGWLITKLECGDPVPAGPKERGEIPVEYQGVVMR